MPNRHQWQASIKSYRKAPGRKSVIHLHRARAEKALGHSLPPHAVVHHADGTRSDDGPLVICQDQAYHLELHKKMRIQKAGGNPWTDRLCINCGPKPIEDFNPSTNRNLCSMCCRHERNEYYKTHPAYRLKACARAKNRTAQCSNS